LPDVSGYNRRLILSKFEKPMRQSLIFLATLLLGANTALAAGDVEAGKVKAYTCTGCHGIPGYNNIYPTYKVPKIGGQNYEYLVLALKAYRDGERDHKTMVLQASSLSDTDISDISAYFSSLGGEG
jgi:cytochrome c553